jgi:hypothetical protein
MTSVEAPPSVFWAHGRAYKDAAKSGMDIARVAISLAKCWGLRVSAGTKVKLLRIAHGVHYRLRLGKCRAAFTVKRGVVCIHVFGSRDKIYETDSFEEVLRRFDEAFVTDADFRAQTLRELGYIPVPVESKTVPYPTDDREWATSIGYMLRPKQQRFFNSVLPLDGTLSERNPQLVIGYGPPGSGKTVVGADLAIEAFMDGHRVDILVPTRSLKAEYGRLLEGAGIPAMPVHDDGPGIRIQRFDEYFASRAGKPVELDRESRIFSLVRGLLDEPGRRARIGAMRGRIDSKKAGERLPVLVDALLDDDAWWRDFEAWCGREKDPIIEPLVPHLRMLSQLRPGLLDAFDALGDIVPATRAALAAAPLVDGGPEARLLIADEAQDLAPAEWHCLLDDAFMRLPGHDRRIVLLGDLRQRVNLVPFAWDDIKRFAHKRCQLEGERVRDIEVDSVSYRMRREVARAAGSVFERPLRPPGKYRVPATLDPVRLPEGGKVEVAIIDERSEALNTALSGPPDGRSASGYLFLIHGREIPRPVYQGTDIVNYSVREAKGLEADSVVVHMPFGAGFLPDRDGTIANDDATEFYTAMTRARDRVLLIVNRSTWNSLSKAPGAWVGADVLEGTALTSAGLVGALDRARVGLSPSQAIEARLRQIEAVANDSGLDSDEVLATFAEAIKDLARFATDAAAIRLVEIGAALAAANSTAFEALRAAYVTANGRRDKAEDVAWLLLFGELAAAAMHAQAAYATGRTCWGPDWLALLRDESQIQRERANEISADARAVWTDVYAEAAMIESAIRTFEAAPDLRVPLASPYGIAAIRPAQVAGFGEPAVDVLAHRRVAAIRARIAAKMEAEERRVRIAIDDHARGRVAEISERLARMETLLGGVGRKA